MITKFILLLLLSITVMQQSNFIPWSATRKLSWADFTAKPDPQSGNAALTSSTILIDYGYGDEDLQYTIRCSFDKSRSWVRVRNEEILAHEQAHFDIAEVYARKLNLALKEYKLKPGSIPKDVNGIYENMMELHRKAQEQYDNETDYSRNKVNQATWMNKIRNDLKTLEAYADYQTIQKKGLP